MISEVQILFNNWCLSDRTYTSHAEYALCPYITYGVSFDIDESVELNERVDEIRIKRGYKPCFDESVEYDDTGWYEFTATIDRWGGNSYRVLIYASPMYVDADDRYDEYEVKLTREEQSAIAVSIDSQCREELGMTLDELLDEAEKIERR